MQIITLPLDDTLIFGKDKFRIRIMNIIGNQIRFGIDAPKHIAVDREEIRLRKLANPRHQG